VGEKVTLIVQLAPTATELPQALVAANSEAAAPVTVTLVIESALVPPLVRVTICAVLVLLTACPGKESDAGASVTAGPVPLPLSATV